MNLNSTSDRCKNSVQSGGGIQGLACFYRIKQVVTTQFDWVTLAFLELVHNLRSCVGQCLEHGCIRRILLRQKVCPIKRHVKVCGSVVNLVNDTAWALNRVTVRADCPCNIQKTTPINKLTFRLFKIRPTALFRHSPNRIAFGLFVEAPSCSKATARARYSPRESQRR
jgi:hypothetical protein